MGRIFKVELEGDHYSCLVCLTQLALRDHLLYRNYRCKHGKAYLFNNVVNFMEGTKEERMMEIGMYAVSDVLCVDCGAHLGWKYEAARDDSQKTLEGKFVIDRSKVLLSPDATVSDNDDDHDHDEDDHDDA